MKRNSHPFLACIVLVSYGCYDQVDVTSVTSEIKKIETAYLGGPIKNELLPIYEPETSMNDEDYREYELRVLKNVKEKIALNGRANMIATTYSKTDYDIGIIPNSTRMVNGNEEGNCPIGSEPIEFFMDCQDGIGSLTGWTTNWPNPNNYHGGWIVTGNKNVLLRFCRVDGRIFENNAGSMIVLKLGAIAPPDISNVKRYFDNEDGGNTNYSVGDIGPNSSTENTALNFYWYQGGRGNYNNPVFDVGYGVIGSGGSYKAQLYTDDENNSNANKLWLNGALVSNVGNLIAEENKNTWIWIRRVFP